jgi:rhodanese-related sulfurtransferase
MPAIGAQPTCSTCPDLRLGLAEFVRLLRGGHVLVVDVRDRASYRRAHLPGALSIPLDALEREATLLRSSDVHIVTYCDDPTGEPSVQAAHVLRGLGVAQAQALEGGFARWVAEGHVVVTQPSVEWHFVRHTV